MRTLLFAALLALVIGAIPPAIAQDAPVQTVPGGTVPGDTLGTQSDSDLWRLLRRGGAGTISIPDKKAAVAIQSDGTRWLEVRNGPLALYGGWALLGMLCLISLFFALRGRIRIEHGRAGITITRFNLLERTAHWLLACSFIVLALTGLNLLYGRPLILPLIGKEAFAAISWYGKLTHNYVAFAFIAALVIVFVVWIVHNFPNRHDLVWLAKGGGIIGKGHPPSRKFNAGQKILFWLVILCGTSIALTGWSLMFPFSTHMFADSFSLVNGLFGTDFPVNLTVVQEQQLAQLWHTVMALFLMVAVIGHIYIGTLGMEGAIQAMTQGEVDLNWAREHHNLWVEETEAAQRAGEPGETAQPAE